MELDIDRDGATVTVNISGTYSAAELQAVLKRIGDARAQIASEPQQPHADTPVEMPANWAYHCQWGEDTGGRFTFALRHEGYGWIGIELPPVEAAKLGRVLSDYLVYNAGRQGGPGALMLRRDDALTNEGSGGATLH